FSSRRRHTRFDCDWSSDVCSSDLMLGVNPDNIAQNIDGGVRYLSQQLAIFGRLDLALVAYNAGPTFAERYARGAAALYGETRARSEERRVGKEWRYGW